MSDWVPGNRSGAVSQVSPERKVLDLNRTERGTVAIDVLSCGCRTALIVLRYE
jgi:hypothetical protein